jgi:hypothetical protein
VPPRPPRTLISLAGLVLAVTLGACSVSVSTAHIGSLQIGSAPNFTTETTTFGPQDTVYAQASADNLPNSVTLKWQVVAEAVAGQASNAPIPALDQSVDVATDATSSVSYSPPTNGWPAGTYKIVVTMIDGATQRDQKSEEFKITGSGSSSPAPQSQEPSSPPST